MSTKSSEPKVNFTVLKEDEPEDFSCGIGPWRPGFIQRLANPKAYLGIFCILGVLQGAYFTYTIGIISTIEKRYAFDSKISGLILIADNISPIITSLIIGYYGGSAHRPRIISFGMMMVVLSCFLSALPYFIFGPGLHLLSKDVKNGTIFEVCSAEDSPERKENQKCDLERLDSTIPAVVLFFMGSFMNGFGSSAFYTAGVTYLDDNVKKKDSPVYFSTTMAIRLFGPSLGFLLSSYCLKKFEAPYLKPNVSHTDPRFVGAWWLGFVVLGVLLFIFSLPMLLFPRKIQRQKLDDLDEPIKPKKEDAMPKLKDMPKSLIKLLRNGIFVAHVLGVIFHINGMLGYYLLMPRYMENHFRQSASGASLVSGSTSIITMLVGIMLGGYIIKRFKPRPRVLTGYMVFVHAISLFTLLAVMFLSCAPIKMSVPRTESGLDLINSCNEDCGCTTRYFHPHCDNDGETTYFSPCHGGCTHSEEVWSNKTGNITIFSGCKCLVEPPEAVLPETESDFQTTGGYCPFNCNMFVPYIVVLSIAKMVSSTGRVGSTLINLRCVDAKDKTFALGVLGCLISIFGFIPYPLIFGALADSTCLIWEESCGRRGNCWLYDIDKLRYTLHGACFAFVGVGTLFDFLVFLMSGRLKNFYEEDDELDGGDGTNKGDARHKLSVNSPDVTPLPYRKGEEDEDILFMRSPNLKAASFNNINSDC